MVQDSALWKSRRYRGYRQPEIVEASEFEEMHDSVFTYDANGNVQTLVKTRTTADGIVQTKTYTFTYTPELKVESITQTMLPAEV